MVISDLVRIVVDEAYVYVEKDFMQFEDIYKGDLSKAPPDIQRREVKTIGAKRKGIVDIKVM